MRRKREGIRERVYFKQMMTITSMGTVSSLWNDYLQKCTACKPVKILGRTPRGGFWKRGSRGNKALLMFKECSVTNECPGLCLAIKGTSITVCGDIFLFLKRVQRKKKVWGKKTSPFTSCSASYFVSSLFLPLKFTMLNKAWWDMRSVGGVKWPVTFTGFLPLLKIHTDQIWYWTGHRSCERHHLSVKRSHAACEIWWEKTKGRETKKNQGQNKCSMVKKQEEDKKSFLLCFILL